MSEIDSIAAARIRVLFTPEQLADRRRELAARISQDYSGRDLLVVCILKGSMFFFVDLVRDLSIPVRCDCLSVASYEGTTSSGVVRIQSDLGIPVANRDVLLVEDIVDTGLTMKHLRELLGTRGPASLRVCSLLDKPSRRRADVTIDYVGFEIPDAFVVGYGMDYAEYFRNLPYIGILEEVPAIGPA